jgi:diamine N-acetyltransferase
MAKRVIFPIENDRIRLRLLEVRDLPMILAWRNQDQIRRWFLHSEIISPQKHKEWYKKYLPRDNDYVFIIEEIRDLNRAVGQISTYRIEWNNKKAEFGRLMIGEPEAQGKGLAKIAAELLLNYAFIELGINRFELEVFGNNEPALAIYRFLGFTEVSDANGLKKMVKISER